uniref:Uncharacterized protein n=1 Tax=Colobus angolensis palliatus TaxID=336983 RepID=A0A2K5JWL2_COLAP
MIWSHFLFMSKVGLRGDGRSEGDEVLNPLRQALDSSMQSHNLYQHPQRLAFHVSAPVASTMQQASGLLAPLPHLSSFTLQPAHSLLPPLGFHGTEKKAPSGPHWLESEQTGHPGHSSQLCGSWEARGAQGCHTSSSDCPQWDIRLAAGQGSELHSLCP